MKKVLLITLLSIVTLGATAQDNNNNTPSTNYQTGISVAYSYDNAIVFDVTQKDDKGLVIGFGGSRKLTKEMKSSAFAVVGYEYKGYEFKSRVGLRTGLDKGRIVYGGTVGLSTISKNVRYILGYDNYNKFQSGIGLVF